MNQRRTAAVIATAGALALSVLNAPAAQAQDTGIVLSDLVINNGKPIVVGTSRVVEPPISFNIALPPGYDTDHPFRYDAEPFIYRGNLTEAVKSGENYIGPGGYTCYELGLKRAHCEGNLYIDPHPTQEQADSNSDATKWRIAVLLRLWKADETTIAAQEYETRSGTVSLRRAAKLSVADATPEPVAKGKKLTLKSRLTRANWTTKKNDGYAGSAVSLQFRAQGATTFKTLKKVTTNSAGALSTTVTATADGFFRWVYYGNSVTGTATSGQDYIDVR
ncbi:hypothetical protein ACOT81_18175 [Streptomyces sp. WI04-05B]|uniref:hypothetical protein n=1 Tax=Streptomyces TaxID=1883 RepID=UPI0029A8A672|nr:MULTISPECIES: hypothetical protein [unclassified Streptomyces]MDX2542686.1 hypothetical protein [Streptomyces sp. WI04-05B]MDX2582295.1 hypothetical protein [Streptomyces sp. WI04-05A]MDX3747708.1 hypothetical protein [Streptomyces sp. AK08-02]